MGAGVKKEDDSSLGLGNRQVGSLFMLAVARGKGIHRRHGWGDFLGSAILPVEFVKDSVHRVRCASGDRREEAGACASLVRMKAS